MYLYILLIYNKMQAYWRSCAMVLGSTIQRAFKDEQQPKMLQIPQLDGS